MSSRPGVAPKRYAAILIVSIASVLVTTTGGAFGATVIDQRNAISVPFGQVVVSASAWLNGSGVDVMSNYGHTHDGPWQCVELVNRLYKARGWITGTWPGNGKDMYGTAPANLLKEPQGNISHISPGDVIVFNTNFFPVEGHVAIVDTVSGPVINTLSQNAFPASLNWTGLSLSGGSILDQGLATMVIGVVHSPPPPKPLGYETAFQAGTGTLWTIGADQHGSWNAAMMPGTGPGIAALPGGGYEVAFQANTGQLWTVGSDAHGGWGYGLKAGTSPSIAALPGGGYEVAFQANTGQLWTDGSDAHGNWGYGLKAGTSPSIAALPSGGYEVAFQANTGQLWTIGSDRHGSWGYGLKAGTSPSIAALPGGGYEVAFQANTGQLWTIGSVAHGSWGYGLKAGTSPSIAALPGGGYEVAFQANTGQLWTIGSDPNGSWGYGLKAGSSPSIAA